MLLFRKKTNAFGNNLSTMKTDFLDLLKTLKIYLIVIQKCRIKVLKWDEINFMIFLTIE